MKKLLSILLSVSLLLAMVSAGSLAVFAEDVNRAEVTDHSFVINKEGVTRFEAEEADLSHHKKSGDNATDVVERSDASNGKFLAAATGTLSDDYYIEFSFTLTMNAEITLSAAYAQTENKKNNAMEMAKSYVYWINGTKAIGLSSRYVLQPRSDVTQWDVVDYDTFRLPKGDYYIRIKAAENTGKGNPNIDYMDFAVTNLGDDLPDGTFGVGDNDIHTELQYNYLNDPIFENIAQYANGSTELSRPKAIVCDFSQDGIADADTYIIQKSATADFADPITVTGLTEKSYEFWNLKLGEHFYYRGGTSLETIENSPVHEMTLNDQAPRNCYVSGVTNVRDIGGWASTLVEGGKIRQGLYYRGANLDGINGDKGRGQLVNDLGVKAEIDIRGVGEGNGGPAVPGMDYYAIPIDASVPGKTTRFDELDEQYQQIFAVVAEADEKPVYLHCAVGADRTGVTTAMLLAVCGVSYEDICRDYLFTNFSTCGPRLLGTEFDVWWNALQFYSGTTTAEKAKTWMMSKGISAETVEKIREIFVEGYEPSDETPNYDNEVYTMQAEHGKLGGGAVIKGDGTRVGDVDTSRLGSVTFNVGTLAAGTYKLDVYFLTTEANSTVTVKVNNVTAGKFTNGNVYSGDYATAQTQSATMEQELTLGTGRNKLFIGSTSKDSGWMELDYIVLTRTGDVDKEPVFFPDITLEAEQKIINTENEGNHAHRFTYQGASGGHFVGASNDRGNRGIEVLGEGFQVSTEISAKAAGKYTITVAYHTSKDSKQEIFVGTDEENLVSIGKIAYPYSGGYLGREHWNGFVQATFEGTVTLQEGTNYLKFLKTAAEDGDIQADCVILSYVGPLDPTFSCDEGLTLDVEDPQVGDTVTITVAEGKEIKAGSLCVVDAEGKVLAVPTRVGFREGGNANQYSFKMIEGAVAVKAEYVEEDATVPNNGNLGWSYNDAQGGLRSVHRMSIIEEDGKLYTVIGGERKEVSEFGVLVGTVSDQKNATEKVKKVNFLEYNYRYDVCDTYQDISVTVTGLNTDDHRDRPIYSCGYMVVEGETYYTAETSKTFSDVA